MCLVLQQTLFKTFISSFVTHYGRKVGWGAEVVVARPSRRELQRFIFLIILCLGLILKLVLIPRAHSSSGTCWELGKAGLGF